MTETILITGIFGQDGAYLAKLALDLGHRVVGGIRRSSTLNDWRLRELGIAADVETVEFELLEESNIRSAIEAVRPTRLFNLAAQSYVGASFRQPLFTSNVDAMGVLRVLEAIRTVDPKIRFYQASSSEMFGRATEVPQRETTRFHPRSPYGVAKAFAHYATVNYREAYALHASSGILFNHESPLRGAEFVTRKITATLARIHAGSDEVLQLGNLDATRDWGHAQDYVRGMWMMTEQEAADDYVLAMGETTSVRDFVKAAAEELGMPLTFSGTGADEVAHDSAGRLRVSVSRELMRPADVEALFGDASKARRVLGWAPAFNLRQLVADMVAADVRRTARGA